MDLAHPADNSGPSLIPININSDLMAVFGDNPAVWRAPHPAFQQVDPAAVCIERIANGTPYALIA